jgi:hypothetical protein
MSFIQKYGISILRFAFFFAVTNATAYVAIFGGMTAAQLVALSPGELHVKYATMIVQAGTVILAFLDRSFATASPVVKTVPPLP